MRLFFSLWPPEPVAEKLAEEARGLAQHFGGRATRRDTIHVTLAFLGEVDDGRLPEVIEAARRVEATSFEFIVDRLGYWRHNRLVWAGCPAVAPPLQMLVDALREQLRAAQIACDESQRFVPHLTLVRKVHNRISATDLPVLAPLSWSCREFALVRSRQTEDGADYLTVAAFPCGSSA